MARVHVLDTSGPNTRLVYHITVPAGTNDVGTTWAAVLVNSGIGGSTVLPDGTGSGGTISAAEKTSIAAGSIYEVEESVPVPPGMTTAQANAFLDSLHAAKTTEVQAAIQSRTRIFGFTRV